MHIQILIIPFLLATGLATAAVSLTPVPGSGTHTIRITKKVEKADLTKFQSVLDEVQAKGLKLHMNAIQLDMFGGNSAVARDIGRIIRAKELNTFVAPDASCVSACIYLAIAGVNRMIYGQVKLHRIALVDEDIDEASIKESIHAHKKASNAYIAEMGVSVLLAEANEFVPNWGLRTLTKDEVKHWGIFGSEPVYEEISFRRAAKASRLSRTDFSTAFVNHHEECRKVEYSFKALKVDCTVARLKRPAKR